MKLHPDTAKDNGEGMKFLNNLKEKWGIYHSQNLWSNCMFNYYTK